MSCIPDIKTTKKMYKLYQQGFSLAQVGKAFGVSRQAVYDRFHVRNLELRTVKPLPFIMFEGKKYTRRKLGYYACTNGDRHYLHRVIWKSINGKIPPGYDIHHIDGDRTNNHIDNLELITKSEHSSKYPHHKNQYTS